MNEIKIGISQGGKALVISNGDALTGGFMYELQKLMNEYDVKEIKGGSIRLSDDREDIISEKCTYVHFVEDETKQTFTTEIDQLETPLTIKNICKNIKIY